MKKKGLTLIEVILSIALLGLLSLAILTVVGNNLSFLSRSRRISQETLLSQQEIELEISDIKSTLRDTSSGLVLNNLVIDGISIDYHDLNKEYNGTDYRVFITPQQVPEYILLETYDVKANLISGANKAYNVYPISTSSVEGTSRPDPATYSTHWMMDLHQWYVSRPGFNIPVPRGNGSNTNFRYYDYLVDNDLEYEIGARYPIFPDDYVLIGTNTTDTLTNLNQYAGRHIIYKVTPAAKSGRIGIPGVSDPVHISGLTRTDNLVLHLDASYIDPSDNEQLVENSNVIKKWMDLSSGIGRTSPSESGVPTASNRNPILMENPIGEDFIARYVRFDDQKNIQITNQGTRNQYLYVYAVAKGNPNNLLFSNGSYNVLLDENAEEVFSDWKLATHSYRSPNNTNGNTFLIGNSNVDIAEIIIYSFASQLSQGDSTELYNTVSSYIKTKYVALDTVGEIDTIYDINVEVKLNQPYSAPSSALAKMKYGLDRYVPVIWENNGTVDTSIEGTFILNGSSITNPEKELKLTVTVTPVTVDTVNILESDMDLLVGNSVQLTAEVLPANATNKNLVWESNNINVATVNSNGRVSAVSSGTATITAKAVSNSEVYGTVTISVLTLEQQIRNELIEELNKLPILTVRNSTSVTPYIEAPNGSNGIVYTFTDGRADGNASISMTNNGRRANINRDSNNDRTGSFKLTATKNNFSESLPYDIWIPRNRTFSRGAVTISKN